MTSSAAHLVNMLKDGRVSSEKIVDTFVRRIEKVGFPVKEVHLGIYGANVTLNNVIITGNICIKPLPQINPLTNCVVDARFEAAKEDARHIDAEIAAALSSSGSAESLFQERPLLGIPFTAKDCFNVKGLSWDD